MSKLPSLKYFILLPILLLALSCNDKSKIASNEINISVSIAPFADFTKQIVGDRANVNTLIPPGSNAHSFEPTPEGLKEVLESDIYFRVGKFFNLENILLDKLHASINNISDCSSNIRLINNNPHYWLSPNNVKIITQNILVVLINLYPQHKNYFTNNRNRFIHNVDSVDANISKQLEAKQDRILFVYHPAWTYLAEHYNLEEISIEHDGKSPKAKDLKKFIELAKEKGVSCIFFDPHFDDSSVSTIAGSLNLQIDSLNPLPVNYLHNLSEIGQKLNKYLK